MMGSSPVCLPYPQCWHTVGAPLNLDGVSKCGLGVVQNMTF